MADEEDTKEVIYQLLEKELGIEEVRLRDCSLFMPKGGPVFRVGG